MPTDARDSAGAKADTLAANDAESTARSGEPTTNVGMAGSLRATLQMFLIIALGLVVVGILSRIVMTIAAARRARVVFNHPNPTGSTIKVRMSGGTIKTSVPPSTDGKRTTHP